MVRHPMQRMKLMSLKIKKSLDLSSSCWWIVNHPYAMGICSGGSPGRESAWLGAAIWD
jgi:hypothetical protein